jgi:hypothetical protein
MAISDDYVGQHQYRGDALYALIRKNIFQTRVVGKTSYPCTDCNAGLCLTPSKYFTATYYEN